MMDVAKEIARLIRQLSNAEIFAVSAFKAAAADAESAGAAQFTASMTVWRNAHNHAAAIAEELARLKSIEALGQHVIYTLVPPGGPA